MLLKVDIIDSLTCGDDTFISFLVEEYGVYRVVQVHTDETRVRITAENIGTVVPKVYISICRA